MATRYLYGMHDPGGEHLFADKPGYIVFTEGIGADPNDKAGSDYRSWANAGYGVLVRLNNGYGTTGTIPTPSHYTSFAARVANFIANSKGCDTWIIGNETNHSQERPNGQTITPAMYVDCFKQVYARVRDAAGTRHALIPAPVAPWNLESGNWLEYHKTIWRDLWNLAGGVAIHAYTHGAAPQLISSEEKVQGWYWHFRTYRDQLGALPEKARGLPVYITESNQGDDGWVNTNTQWVQAAYDEIDRWNAMQGTQKILCLCLYRWPDFDRWGIANKPGVHVDFRAAVAKGYQSPIIPVGGNEKMPETKTDIPQEKHSLPRNWDGRLTQRGVNVITPQVTPGQKYWRVKAARWFNEDEAGGRHHIYVEAPQGKMFRVTWPSGEKVEPTKSGMGFDAGNFPMSPSLNEFSVRMHDNVPSETVTGIGMGANGNPGHHTSTLVAFELTTMPQAHEVHIPAAGTGDAPPAATMFVTAVSGLNLRAAPESGDVLVAIPFGAEVAVTGVSTVNGWLRATYNGMSGWLSAAYVSETQPQTPVEPPPASGDNWARSIAFVRRWEGGWADDPNDKGGATNKGITLATYTRWRKAQGQSAPTKDDLRRLSDAEANQIYFELYWRESGASELSWPLALAHFDTAVNAGVGTAREMLQRSNGNFLAYVGHVGIWYTTLADFQHFGRAWARRRFELLLEAAK